MKKSVKKPTNKDFQKQIGEIGNGLNFVFEKVKYIEGHLGGLESLTMYLSEFLEKRAEFEKFLETKIKEQKEKEEESKPDK